MSGSKTGSQDQTTEAPCVGLDPDTYECPHCGATLDDECGTPTGAWRVAPGDPTEVQTRDGAGWATHCYCADTDAARKLVRDNIREERNAT